MLSLSFKAQGPMRKIDTHFQSLVVTGRDLCVRQVRLDSQQYLLDGNFHIYL